MPDHVHLLVSVDPQDGVHRLVKQAKAARQGCSAKSSPTYDPGCPPLWTNSYFVATVGDTTPEDVKSYVENQHNTPLPPPG